MDIGLFLGRFHPLVVHLPIGFLLLAAIFEGLSRLKKFDYLGKAVPLTLLLGALSAMISVLFGFLIAGDKGYDDTILSWHRWLGILVAGSSTLIWIFRSGKIIVSGKVMISLFIALIVFISLTGHLGGTLTHGEGYLVQYAPAFIKNIAGVKKEESLYAHLPAQPDSVVIFADLIDPILQTNCMPCHTQSQKKGGLSLVNYTDIMEGGESGSTIVPGKPAESELFKRITLPVTHTKFMPLKETPLSFAEVNLIEWWIQNEADESLRLGAVQIPEHLSHLLMRDFKYDVTPKPYYEITKAPEISDSLILQVVNAGFKVRKLASHNFYLDVSMSADQEMLTREQVDALIRLKDNITWLDLHDKIKSGSLVTGLSQLEHLTRLNLSNNQLTDDDIQSLSSLKHLESLNLYGTGITDEAIAILANIKSLKRLYAWQTNVSDDAVELALNTNPQLEIVKGYQQ